MGATTNRLRRPWRGSLRKIQYHDFIGAIWALIEAGVLFGLAQHGWWVAGLFWVGGVWVWPLRSRGMRRHEGRSAYLFAQMPHLLMMLSVVMIIAVSPRLVSQVAVAILYVLWRWWWREERIKTVAGLGNLLIVQATVFEAIFLVVAIWRTENWVPLGLVWVGSYLSVYSGLRQRGEKAAGVLAATWAVVAAQVAWVMLLWLFTYTIGGGYILVPQPVLVLTALGYCFGSIYLSQREGSLNRGRLTEYLLIGLIMVLIVAIGTSWRGTL